MLKAQSNELARLSVLLGETPEDRGNLNRRQGNSISGFSPILAQLYQQAGKPIPQPTPLLLFFAGALMMTLVLAKLFGFIAVFLPLGLLAVWYLRLVVSIRSRAESFERDYTAFLLSLASSIRTGLDPLIAFLQCGTLFPVQSVLAIEVAKTARSLEEGIAEDVAFYQFANTIAHPDVGLLRAALVLSRRQGSSLGACLHRLARVTRQRQSFRRKIRGAVAMQRLSAFGIAACTLIVAIIQCSSNPRAIHEAWLHPIGWIALSAGIGLVLFGLAWMIFLSRRKL